MSIHKLIIYNFDYDKGAVLFDDGMLEINDLYLINLIRATTLLGTELHQESNYELHEMEIGELQIAITNTDELFYIIVQEALDNEAFTRKILKNLINQFHQKFLKLDLDTNFSYQGKYQENLALLLETMKFPDSKIKEFDFIIHKFLANNPTDVFFLTDLDDGIVKIWKDEQDGIVNVLSEILSELYIERSWFGEIPNYQEIDGKQYSEVWFIHRLGSTDFCICGRTVIKAEKRLSAINSIEKLTLDLTNLL